MKLPKAVDFIVVGAGLVGLSTFKKLKTEGHKVMLIEKSADLTGTLLPSKAEISKTPESIAWIKSENHSAIQISDQFTQSFGLGKKGLIPFMGFGEEKMAALDIIDDFVAEDSKMISEINVEDLLPHEGDLVFTHTQISSFGKEEADEAAFSLVELNGKHQLNVQKIFWTAPIQELDFSLPKGGFSNLRQKIKRAKHFDAITAVFEVAKEELSENANHKFVFSGEDGCAWLGCALTENTLTFTSFFPQALSSDHDFLRKNLKTLKRQLRKAFPEAFPEESLKSFVNEKICLHKSVASNLSLAQNKEGGLKEIPNMYFLGSHKTFWPQNLENKLASIKSFDFSTDQSEQVTSS